MRLARLDGTESTRGSGFVERTRRNGKKYQHGGVDVAGSVGDNVYAVYDGTVTKVVPDEDGNDGGIRVWISSSGKEGERVGYFHLEKALVKEGDVVEGGDKIGKLGTTGNSATSGREAHVHVQKEQNGKVVNPWNP